MMDEMDEMDELTTKLTLRIGWAGEGVHKLRYQGEGEGEGAVAVAVRL